MTELTETIAKDLEALCALLDAELARQQRVLDTVTAQGAAARSQNLTALDSHTATLSQLLHESLRSEQERLRLLRPVVEYFGLKGADQTLSNLIEAAPSPWKDRLADFQNSLKRIVADSRAEIQRNAGLMRTSLRRIDNVMEQAFQDSGARQYTSGGNDSRRDRAAAVLDTIG